MSGAASGDYREVQARSGSYVVPLDAKLKRLWLASFLGALAAIVLVTLAGLALGLGINSLFKLISSDWLSLDGNGIIASGFSAAMLACIFNWYFFWISVPVTTLILRFALGHLPWHGRTDAAPYLLRGAIIGALLVAAPCALAGYVISQSSFDTAGDQTRALTALTAAGFGAMVGAACGTAVGATWRMIVRPQSQLRVFNPAETF